RPVDAHLIRTAGSYRSRRTGRGERQRVGHPEVSAEGDAVPILDLQPVDLRISRTVHVVEAADGLLSGRRAIEHQAAASGAEIAIAVELGTTGNHRTTREQAIF